jgi:ubiquitin carboxyl-terminal hydrolase 40
MQCEECHTKYPREEEFFDLMVNVKGIKGLQSSLELMRIPERFEGDDKYCCEVCKKKCNAIRTYAIKKSPPIITLALNRYDYVNNERKKLNDRFEFPLELNIGVLLETPSESPDNEYVLKAIIIHRGGAYGGHYHAYIHDELQEGNWDLPALDKFEQEPNMIKKVVNEAIQKKEEANPLRALIEKKSLNETKEETDYDFDKCDFPLPYQDKLFRAGWYDFNDTNVTAIPFGRLQQQFGHSNESAYILIYKRKSLKWKFDDPKVIPLSWVDHIKVSNSYSQTLRDTYEFEENHVELMIQDISNVGV